jgi:hypothetical protein
MTHYRGTYRFGPFSLFMPDRTLKRLDPDFEPDRYASVDLTPQEFAVLLELVTGAFEKPGEKFHGKDLAAKLLMNPDAFRTHVTNLRAKLGKGTHEFYIPRGVYILAAEVHWSPPASDTPNSGGSPKGPLCGLELLAGTGVIPEDPPYVGPQPFAADQVNRFFGRNEECGQLMGHLLANRVVLLYSPSGAGKSSLLNTALRARLMEAGCRVLFARLGLIPGIRTYPERIPNLYTLAALTSMAGTEELDEATAALPWTRFFSLLPPESRETILILDQLEEIITTPLGEYFQRREFFVQLRQALEDHPSLRILLAFREEHLAELKRLAQELASYWQEFRLEKLSSAGAALAISKPATLQGVTFHPEVLGILISGLSRNNYEDARGQTYDEAREFIEPLELQLVLHGLWKRLPRDVKFVSKDIFEEAMGGAAADGVRIKSQEMMSEFVTSLTEDFCMRAIEEVGRERAFPVESIDLGCQHFISARGTRLLVHQETELTGSLPNDIVGDLARRHLLRAEDRRGERWYELAHDSLVQPIQRRAVRISQELRPLDDVARMVFASVTATMASLLVTMITRAILAGFHKTLTQPSDAGFIAGWFQGVIGALVWSVFIAGVLSRWLFKGSPVASRLKGAALRVTAIGALAGLVGGAFCTIALLYAQRSDSLQKAGWIFKVGNSPLTAFSETGLGYSMLLFGTALGLCSGFTTIQILSTPGWGELEKLHWKPASRIQFGERFLMVLRRTLSASLVGFLPWMSAAAVLFYFLLPEASKPPGFFHRVAGECFSITFGGMGIVAGLLFALLLLRTGVTIPGDKGRPVSGCRR